MQVAAKVYHVERTGGEVTCRVEIKGNEGAAFYELRHVKLHSPTGFEFGYGGSGPSDLALSILLDYFGEGDAIPTTDDHHALTAYLVRSKARRVYQNFKWLFITPQDEDRFHVTSSQIAAWLRNDAENEALEHVLMKQQQYIEDRMERRRNQRH